METLALENFVLPENVKKVLLIKNSFISKVASNEDRHLAHVC
jgi:hypothetical protein